MNGRDYLNEVMALTPEMVNKPNYNMNQDKFNALARLYSNILFITAAIGYSKETEDKEVYKKACDELLENNDHYSYVTSKARIMSRIVAKYGIASRREEIALYNKVLNQAMKEQFCVYYEVVKLYSEHRGDEDIQAIVDGNPGKELYNLCLEVETLKMENAKRTERIKQLDVEKTQLEAELKTLEQNSSISIKAPKHQKSFISNLLNFFKQH